MRRLAISVEGPTEREFVNRVLKPQLLVQGWEVVKPVALNGGVSLRRVKEELRLLVPQFELVTTLYDLYRFDGRDGRDADALETCMAEAVGAAGKLLPYVQRHEFEALIFSAPDIVAAHFGKQQGSQLMHAACTGCASPEDINHGYDTCPSRRLQRIFPGYEKVRHGSLLTGRIGLAQLAASCPRFGAWVARLGDAAATSGRDLGA